MPDNISAVTPADEKVTTGISQTLTCHIDNFYEEPKYIEWLDPDGKSITTDTEGYSIHGSVTVKVQNGSWSKISGFQEELLTISPRILKELKKKAENSEFHFLCSAWSSEYSDSLVSRVHHEVPVKFLNLSKLTSHQLFYIIDRQTRLRDELFIFQLPT